MLFMKYFKFVGFQKKGLASAITQGLTSGNVVEIMWRCISPLSHIWVYICVQTGLLMRIWAVHMVICVDIHVFVYGCVRMRDGLTLAEQLLTLCATPKAMKSYFMST